MEGPLLKLSSIDFLRKQEAFMSKYIMKDDAINFLSEVMAIAGLTSEDAKHWAELLTETSP
jgi:hypothetical protein